MTQNGARRAHVVLAHPWSGSFNAAWFRRTCEVLQDQGYEVSTSDLFSLGFDPAERGDHYGDYLRGDDFDVLKFQSDAQKTGCLPPDVSREIAKLKQADLVVLHFPLWWFAPPAMLKGWMERVLVHGEFHTSEDRFEDGLAKGWVLFCVTCGVDEDGGRPDGYEGDTRMLLWPLAFSLFYCGFEVYQPEIAYGVHGFHEGDAKTALEARLHRSLAEHDGLLSGLTNRSLLRFNRKTDFGRDGRLKPGAPIYSPFISHSKPS